MDKNFALQPRIFLAEMFVDQSLNCATISLSSEVPEVLEYFIISKLSDLHRQKHISIKVVLIELIKLTLKP